jgi:hypothetical protein
MDTANPPQTYHLKVLSSWYYPLLFISLITLIVLLTLVSDFIDEQFGQGTGNYTSLAGVLACYLLFDLVIKKRLRTPLQIHFDGKQLQLDYFTHQHVLSKSQTYSVDEIVSFHNHQQQDCHSFKLKFTDGTRFSIMRDDSETQEDDFAKLVTDFKTFVKSPSADGKPNAIKYQNFYNSMAGKALFAVSLIVLPFSIFLLFNPKNPDGSFQLRTVVLIGGKYPCKSFSEKLLLINQ